MILAFLHDMPHVKGGQHCCPFDRRKPCQACGTKMHWEPSPEGIMFSCPTCDPLWHEATAEEMRSVHGPDMGVSKEKKKK